MKNAPIRKLNKKLIYICLMSSAAIAIPLMILPMACQQKSREKAREEHPVSAMVHADDAFALSGTEKFPASYDSVKQFEQQNSKNIKPSAGEDAAALAFAQLGDLDQAINQNTEQSHKSYGMPDENPWLEAKKEEQKRRADNYYNARRSGILFVDNTKQNGRKEDAPTDPTMRMLEKSLELAEKHLSPGAQASKDDVFFKRNDGKNIGVITEAQPFTLSEGTLIPATLLSEINTDLPGPILARVTHNIWDSRTGQTLLIPQNSTLIGEYQSSVGHGQQRAQIVWSRVIFPNQQSVNLGAMVGLDKRGVSGASGQVDNHYDKVALGLLMTTALGAGVRMTQGTYDPHNASMAQEFGNSLAQETMRLGNKITDKMLSVPPTIVVPMGKRLNVFVEQDLHLRPYRG